MTSPTVQERVPEPRSGSGPAHGPARTSGPAPGTPHEPAPSPAADLLGAALGTTAPRAWTFEEASAEVLDFLQREVPLGLWAVTRRDGDDQVFVDLQDRHWGLEPGVHLPWPGSLCERMVAGAATVVPGTAADPDYASAPAVGAWGIRGYLGVPIRTGDGQLFGTLCGFHPEELDDDAARRALPLVRLLAALLGQILAAEALREQASAREAELRRLATTDDLTGLATRRVLHDRLEHALDLHRTAHRPLTLLLVDVDRFKAVNDEHGHAAGDELLVQLTRLWEVEVSAGNTLARLGGDEFALLVENGVDPDDLARRVSHRLRSTHRVGGVVLEAGVSVGLAHLPGDAPTPSAADLLGRADAAMYAAKRSGGARLVRHGDG